METLLTNQLTSLISRLTNQLILSSHKHVRKLVMVRFHCRCGLIIPPFRGHAVPPSSGAVLPTSGAVLSSSGAVLPTSGAVLPSSGAVLPSSGAVLYLADCNTTVLAYLKPCHILIVQGQRVCMARCESEKLFQMPLQQLRYVV